MRVIVDHSFHKSSNTGMTAATKYAMVAMSRLELLRKESARKKKLARSNLCSSELCNSLCDGGLPRPSGTVEPHNESVRVDLLPSPS